MGGVGCSVQCECHLECGAVMGPCWEPNPDLVMYMVREGDMCHWALVPASQGVDWIHKVRGG